MTASAPLITDWISAVAALVGAGGVVVAIRRYTSDLKQRKHQHAENVGAEAKQISMHELLITVFNGGAAPIYNCYVKAYGIGADGKETSFVNHNFGMVSPAGATHKCGFDGGTVTLTEVRFQDPSGKRWRRTSQGVLEEQP